MGQLSDLNLCLGYRYIGQLNSSSPCRMSSAALPQLALQMLHLVRGRASSPLLTSLGQALPTATSGKVEWDLPHASTTSWKKNHRENSPVPFPPGPVLLRFLPRKGTVLALLSAAEAKRNVQLFREPQAVRGRTSSALPLDIYMVQKQPWPGTTSRSFVVTWATILTQTPASA